MLLYYLNLGSSSLSLASFFIPAVGYRSPSYYAICLYSVSVPIVFRLVPQLFYRQAVNLPFSTFRQITYPAHFQLILITANTMPRNIILLEILCTVSSVTVPVSAPYKLRWAGPFIIKRRVFRHCKISKAVQPRYIRLAVFIFDTCVSNRYKLNYDKLDIFVKIYAHCIIDTFSFLSERCMLTSFSHISSRRDLSQMYKNRAQVMLALAFTDNSYWHT